MSAPTESSAAVGEAEVEAVYTAMRVQMGHSCPDPTTARIYASEFAKAALTAHPSVAAGDGGEIEEPTEAMLEAARDWSYRKYGKPIGNDAAIGCWKAMVASAQRPAPAQAPETAGGEPDSTDAAKEPTDKLRAIMRGHRPDASWSNSQVGSKPETAGGDLAKVANLATRIERIHAAIVHQTHLYHGKPTHPGLATGIEIQADFLKEAVTELRAVRTATPSAAPGGSDREDDLDRALSQALQERDEHSDALLRASEEMDGPEWGCSTLLRAPGETGDLNVDVPVLAAEWVARAKRAEAAIAPQPASPGAVEHEPFPRHARVRKTKGSSWQGRVVGYYSTALTPNGVCVESEREPGSVHIYPASALEAVAEAAPPTGPDAAGAAGEGWLSIETAPRDGSKFDAWAVHPATGTMGARFTDVQMRGDGTGFGVVIHRPKAHWEYLEQDGPTYPAWRLTHWRRPPLPPALAALPAASGAGEDADAGVGR